MELSQIKLAAYFKKVFETNTKVLTDYWKKLICISISSKLGQRESKTELNCLAQKYSSLLKQTSKKNFVLS